MPARESVEDVLNRVCRAKILNVRIFRVRVEVVAQVVQRVILEKVGEVLLIGQGIRDAAEPSRGKLVADTMIPGRGERGAAQQDAAEKKETLLTGSIESRKPSMPYSGKTL